jgi:LacI family transcriptional regulator
VSRSTVSLVLRNSALVAEPTNLKVRETIDRLGYVYNRTAAIRSRLSHLIGIIIPDLTNPFFSELTAGIDTVLNEAGWVSLLGNSWESVSTQNRILQRMQEHNVDAVIVCPAVDSSPTLSAGFSKAGLPLLQVLRRVGDDDDYLGIDYEHGMALAVDHLCELGHREIVFLGDEKHHSAAFERRVGYEKSIRAHGLSPRYEACALTRPGAAEAVAGLFGRPAAPTALVCFNDVVAIGAIAGLERLGFQVGRDVSVVGFDNVSEASFVNPRLTTIDSSARSLGMEAARRALDRISGRHASGRSQMSTRLIKRDTTGPAPSQPRVSG